MSVELSQMRELLLPELWKVTERYSFAYTDYRSVFGTPKIVIPKPHIWVPKLTMPEAIVVGAAAAIVKNPEVTRRFWAGWKL